MVWLKILNVKLHSEMEQTRFQTNLTL